MSFLFFNDFETNVWRLQSLQKLPLEDGGSKLEFGMNIWECGFKLYLEYLMIQSKRSLHRQVGSPIKKKQSLFKKAIISSLSAIERSVVII